MIGRGYFASQIERRLRADTGHSESLECAAGSVAYCHAACEIAACAEIAGTRLRDERLSLVVFDITLVASIKGDPYSA
jgi:hypothetical protein